MSNKDKNVTPKYIKFIFGGISGMMATCCVQPFDVVKTRMQISGIGSAKKEYKNALDCFLKTFKKEGIPGLYLGIGAALLRQATYTTTRLGVYTSLIDYYKAIFTSEPTIIGSMAMGTTAGAIGAFVGTPAEVALIRMQTDAKLPEKDRRNYRNVGHALTRILNDEGLSALWRGCIPTVVRAMIVNMTQLASYSQFKYFFHKYFGMDNIQLHFTASMLSGFLTSLSSMPLDIAKTRIQNMKKVDGKFEYDGTLDAMTKIVRKEGPFALWKGLTPYFFRIGPHTVLTFVILEQLNALYKTHVAAEAKLS